MALAGTNPLLSKLFLWLARNKSTAGYNVSQTVVPTASLMDLWPKSPVLRYSTGVVPNNIDIVTAAEGIAGPSHAMIHHLYINANPVGPGVGVFVILFDPTSNQNLVLQYLVFAAGGDQVATIRDIYVPSGWIFRLANNGGTPGDVIYSVTELSQAPIWEPLPRTI